MRLHEFRQYFRLAFSMIKEDRIPQCGLLRVAGIKFIHVLYNAVLPSVFLFQIRGWWVSSSTD